MRPRRSVSPASASALALRSAVLAALVAGGLSLFTAGPACAYVRSRSNGCTPVFWAQGCVYVQPDSALFADLTQSDTLRIINEAISSWEDRTQSAFLKVKYRAPDGPKEVQFDRVPVIKFRTSTWCRPASGNSPETCYDHSAAAITTVFFVDKPGNAQDGQILDADIELNAVDNRFYDADQTPVPSDSPRNRTLTDLWNTLTHELGHLQGLEHTCRITDKDVPACVVDNSGHPSPLCNQVPRSNPIAETTMFAVAAPMETKKRIPKADDVQGIVDAYPLSKDPKVCELPVPIDPVTGKPIGGGCAVVSLATASRAPVSSAGLLWPLCLLLCAGLLGRRRRAAPTR